MVSPLAFAVVAFSLAMALSAAVALPLRRRSPGLFAAMVVVLPLLAFALYGLTGTPAALEPGATGAGGPASRTPQSVPDAIRALQAELETNPRQPEGWTLLARAQSAQGEMQAASTSYARALALTPDEPLLLVEAALARAQASGRQFDDAALGMLQHALAIDPSSQRARWFVGVALRQRGDDAGAASAWEALLPAVDAGTADSLREQIDLARAAAGQPPLPGAPRGARPGGAGDPSPSSAIAIRVSLDPAFAARTRLPTDAAVFVLARVPGGPPMPVAAERIALTDLPRTLVLDDGDSPMPTQRLSALREVDVVARLAMGGTAAREGGDVESRSVRVALPSATTVELVIGAAP